MSIAYYLFKLLSSIPLCNIAICLSYNDGHGVVSRFWLLNILESSNTVKLFGNYLILLVLLLSLAMWENGSIYSQTNFVPLLRQSSSEYSIKWINDSEILDSGWWKQEPSLYGPCELYPAILLGVFSPRLR